MKKNAAVGKVQAQMLAFMRVFLSIFASIFIVVCIFLGICLIFKFPACAVEFIGQHASLVNVLFLVFAFLAIIDIGFYDMLMRRSMAVSSRELRVLAHSLPGGICKCISEGNYDFLFISDGFLDMLGYCAEEIKTNFHNSALALVHSADRERIAAQLARESHFTEPFTLEYRVVTKAGKTLWLLDKVCLIHDENGSPVLYSMRIDNTAKKEAEMQLHVRSEWFRIAMEHSKSHIFEYNVVTHSFDSVISPPDSMQPLLPKHIESMPENLIDSGFVAPETADGLRSAFRAIAGGAASAACLLKVKDAVTDGYSLWLSLALTTVFDEYGMPVCAIGTLEDITEAKRAQERYDEEKRYHDAMLSTTLASILFDVETGAVISARISAIFSNLELPEGCNLEERLPELARKTVFLNDRAEYIRTLNRRNLRECYNDGTSCVTLEYRTVLSDGSLAWRQMTVNMVKDPQTDTVTGFAYFTDIDTRKRKEIDLLYKAEHDSLTGLWNRRALETRLTAFFKTADAHANLHAFYIIDMDDFKAVNDTCGHIRGDEVLCAIAAQLRSIFRKTDIIARLADDEFVVFMKNAGTSARIADKAREICTRIQNIELGSSNLPPPRASIGIAIAPDAGTSFEALYAKADEAHYVAKRGGKNRYSIFQEPL